MNDPFLLFKGCKLKRGNTVEKAEMKWEWCVSLFCLFIINICCCCCQNVTVGSLRHHVRQNVNVCSAVPPQHLLGLSSLPFFFSHLPFVFFVHLSVCCHTTHLRGLLLWHHSRQVKWKWKWTGIRMQREKMVQQKHAIFNSLSIFKHVSHREDDPYTSFMSFDFFKPNFSACQAPGSHEQGHQFLKGF